MRSVWRRARRRVKDALYGGVVRLLRRWVGGLSDAAAWRWGVWLGRGAYRLARRQVAQAKANLALAFPERSPDEREALARACFENLGVNFVEILRFDRLTPETVAARVELVGAEHLDAALKEGKGCIGLTAHLGNWELLAAALVQKGYRVDALVRELRSRTLNRLLAVQRKWGGYRPISRTAGLREAIRALRDNRLLGVLVDLDTSVASVFVSFFGRAAATPIGPVLLSQRLGVPVVPLFIRRLDRFRHRIEICPALKWDGNDLAANVQQYTSLIEARIRSAPEQWIWMHQRWRRQPGVSSLGSSSV